MLQIRTRPHFFLFLLISLPLIGVIPAPAAAQVIPAQDGTQTQVNRQNERFNIDGGQRSADGANLFHSFEQFGLTAGQVANFQSSPDIQNILTRVTGGNASLIDGLIQVSGGNSNLFLMNPAGVIFGANARLDVPAAFTATTASGIGLDGGWFQAIGSNDYAALVGHPSNFAFSLNAPLVNAGDLSVLPGQSLTLLGGTVVNTGRLTGGQVTVMAIAGQNRVRLSQAGNPLSIEVTPSNEPLPFTPLSLPQLLTGGTLGETGISVAADGSVQLTGSGIPTAAGTAVASGTIQAPTIAVLGDQVALSSARLDASGNGGGAVWVGGGAGLPGSDRTYVSADSVIHADVLESGNGGQVMVWADESTLFEGTVTARGSLFSPSNGGFVEVSGRQTLAFTGLADLSAPNGNLGTLLLDPRNIRIANLPSSPGVDTALPAIFQADFPTDDITINFATLQQLSGNVILEATNDIAIDPGVSLFFTSPGGSVTFTADSDNDGAGNFSMTSGSTLSLGTRDLNISGADITLGNILALAVADGASTGNINLSATQDIIVQDIRTTNDSNNTNSQSGNVTLTSGGNITAGIIETRSPGGDGGTVTIAAQNDVLVESIRTTTDSIVSTNRSGSVSLTGSTVRVTSGGDSIDALGSPIALPGQVDITTSLPFTIGDSAVNGTTGTIDASPINITIVPSIPSPIPSPSPVPVPVPSPSPVPTPSPIPSPISTPDPTPIENTTPIDSPNRTPSAPVNTVLTQDSDSISAEQEFTGEFQNALGVSSLSIKSVNDARQTLRDIEAATGEKPALLYINFAPVAVDESGQVSADNDRLDLTLITSAGVTHQQVNASRSQVLAIAQGFQQEVTNPRKTQTQSYLATAQQLYQWMIVPIQPELEKQQITNIAILPAAGLRSLPFSALHNGQQFLIEQYSLGIMPSLSLTDSRYASVHRSQILAMGISESTQGELPLPTVPAELSSVMGQWQGKQFLNGAATLENLRSARQQTPFGMIHLATHANFLPNAINESYIQLWNQRLQIDQIGDMGWNEPPVQLLVLSACRTAIGNEQAELGFAGLAAKAGVQTVVASLWFVDDASTTALMSRFYEELRETAIKAAALQQTQIAMLKGQVKDDRGNILAHPYYWASFTMVGSPW